MAFTHHWTILYYKDIKDDFHNLLVTASAIKSQINDYLLRSNARQCPDRGCQNTTH